MRRWLDESFGVAQLEGIVDDHDRDRLLELLEEALAARVIEELPGEVGRYQFSHSLVQHILMGELSTTRRVRLHARISEALEELYGENAEVHAAELAHHFAEAELLGRPEKLVRYSLLAGEKALGAYAYEEAVSQFQRALTAKEGQPMDAETAALLHGLGRSQAAIFVRLQLQEATDNLVRAFDYYVEAGDVEKAVAVAALPAAGSFARFLHNAGIISRALTLVPPDSHEAGRLLVRYGFGLGRIEGDYNAAQEAFDHALGIAQREHDQALEMWTLATACYVAFHDARYRDPLGFGPKAIKLAQQLDEPRAEVQARFLHPRGSVLLRWRNSRNVAPRLDAAGCRGAAAGSVLAH